MWNHAQNCSPSGDEDTNESEPNPWLKEKIEKSLDLSQYLKYLDQLFGQATSESDSSDSDEGEKRPFTEFRQPSVAAQPPDRPQYGPSHNHLLLGASIASDSSNLVHCFTALKSADHFHSESNISSSSSLSSIDSGTSSLNLSAESFAEAPHGKTENNANGVAKSMESQDEEKSGENKEDKGKKSQKKKKSGRNNNETFPGHHKPSSGGKGNNGSKGGGGGSGGPSLGGSSSDNSGSSSGSSSSQSISGNSGSPGAKSRSGKQGLQKQTDSQPDILKATNISLKCRNNVNLGCNGSVDADLQRALGLQDSNSDSLILNGNLVDSFETDDTFDSRDMQSFALNSILDSITDEETSISDFISMSTTLNSASSSPSSTSQLSTNLFSKIAESAAASAKDKLSRNEANEKISDSSSVSTGHSKSETKKRKMENPKDQNVKFPKLTEKQRQSRIEYLNAKRRKIYVYISRKEVPKTQKSRSVMFKEGLAANRKLAQACARHVRKNAIQSQKCMKESVCKAKRLTQEMEAFWKSVEKSERDLRRKMEKESGDKLKADTTLTKIPNSKLNSLIIQIELFVNKLLNKEIIKVNEDDLVFTEDQGADERIQDTSHRERLKSELHSAIDRAVQEHYSLVKLLDMGGTLESDKRIEHSPLSISSELKKHQVFGIKWIKNLYNKGFNGILADEAGLEKKVEVTGFLSHLAEVHNLWGPFLIVSPSTAVNTWQQEFQKICPKFKVVTYSGKPLERKILRQGWEKNDIHTEMAGFHVVITSYQVMVADLKYFSKTKWQYLIMDDSQNIITSSTKWIALLSFRCRNKLLLCDDPRLNSIRHLCSYLYFIMPSLFDTQKDLSEWLLMELESPTLNSEERQSNELERLQNVVKHFLLRRELHDIEVKTAPCSDLQLNCTLTKRQRQLYSDLLVKANLPEVLSHLETCRPEEIQARMKSVLNLSIQLGMVCNHPDLIEGRMHSNSFWMVVPSVKLPKLIYQNEMFPIPNLNTQQLVCIYNANNIYRSVLDKNRTHNTENVSSTWSFLRLLNLSWKEAEELFVGGVAARLNYLVKFRSVLKKIQYDSQWVDRRESRFLVNYPTSSLSDSLSTSELLSAMIFTSHSLFGGSWKKCKTCLIAENSVQFRTLKSRTHFQGNKNCQNDKTKSCDSSSIFKSTFASLEYPDILHCYSSTVFSEGFKPCVSECDIMNRQILTEICVSVMEFKNKIEKDVFLDSAIVSAIKDTLISVDWSSRFLPGHNLFVEDSCKMVKLEQLLTVLKQQNIRVLIVSYIKDTLILLEEFLKMRQYKYVRVENSNAENVPNNAFVYLMYADSTVENDLKISVDSVIFFDHDWGTKLEDQKIRILSKFGYGNRAHQVDFYRFVCKGTIEERMIALAKERNIVSLTLSKDLFENKQVASVPALRSLLSILMSKVSSGRACTSESISSIVESSPSPVKSSTVIPLDDKGKVVSSKIAKYMTDHYLQGDERLVKDIEGSDSASPICSEDPEVYMDDEESVRVATEYQDEDNFSLSFDEGYMGMSPDSFEEVTIKSDYEEHSSPKKIKVGRGSGKRGRPPSRVRLHRRDIGDGTESFRRGPGRPRLKTVGPANQGTRGRKPGRPPLTKKAETIASGLASLSSNQNVFGFYSSSDLELS